jgi:hypothetical protein
VPKPIGHSGLPTGDDDTTSVPPSDDDGSVVLAIQNPSALDPAGSTSFTALFVESDRGWLNLVECFTSFCASQLPAGPGDSVLVNGIDTTLRDDLVSRDVGDEVTLGPATARKQQDGRFVYYSTVETRALDFGSRPMGLSFGGEWPEYSGVDDVVPPTPMVALLPSTSEVFELFSSDLLRLEWEPGSRGEVYLLVTTPVERRLYQLEDTGSYDLDLRGLGLPDDAPVTLDLGRWSQGGVDAGGNVAHSRCTASTVVRPPSGKAGTSRVAANGPSSCARISASKGQWPRKVESPRLTSIQSLITPAVWASARAGFSCWQIWRTRVAAASGSRARVLASRNSRGEGWRRPAARVCASQRSNSGQLCTVWEPVGSSSRTRILGLVGTSGIGQPARDQRHGTIVP